MAEQRLASLRRQRLEKLKQLQELGVNPYPSQFEKQIDCVSAQQKLGQRVQTAGRIMAIRGHGGLVFMDLVDASGKIQLWLQKDKTANYELVRLLDRGDFLGVKGKVGKTKAGEISIQVEKFWLLAKSLRPLPAKWYGLRDVESRYRQRYLDLIMNSQVRQVFVVRSQIVRYLREFLDRHGFLEVETPILQPIYGGAAARPFITRHHALEADFYLRISNELYLKRLLVGGFEKVYEISRDFRNEGIDRFHNPEFTQIEFYWAYADYQKLMEFSEKMLVGLVKTLTGKTILTYQGQKLNFQPPWPRLDFDQELKKELGFSVLDFQTVKELRKELRKRKIKLEEEKTETLGRLYDRLYKKYLRPKIKGPAFVVDYPAAMIALAKRKEADPRKIASFQLLIQGTELIKAYNELNDPLDQRARWQAEEKLARRGAEETERLDEDYLRALEYGMPPTAGWGLGIDRLTMFLTDQLTLKDVILFPTLRPLP